MGKKSSRNNNDNGRAFEYITLRTLVEEIRKNRDVYVRNNSSFAATKNSWNQTEPSLQSDLKKAAEAAVDFIFESEPMILDNSDGRLELMILSDQQGKKGDVRDILIQKKDIEWEIGLSLKHNHAAVKHPRISKTRDFGKVWYGIPCSQKYWEEVTPIFTHLEEERKKGIQWDTLPNKEGIYISLLNAFKDEVLRSTNSDSEVPTRMFEFLIGKQDFYKVRSKDSKRITEICAFNLKGTLNRATDTIQPKNKVPIAKLPTKIINIDFKSSTTLIFDMDNEWKFSFRLHNAKKNVEPSLKFDIQIIEKPSTFITCVNYKWGES